MATAPRASSWVVPVRGGGPRLAFSLYLVACIVYDEARRRATWAMLDLREKLRAARHEDGAPVYTPLVGLSLLVFIALACQCMSTLAAVRRETA